MGSINYIYNALGQKVNKTVLEDGVTNVTDYLDGYQYLNKYLKYFPTAEGYVNAWQDTGIMQQGSYLFNYVYSYTDHLGNIRLSYAKDPKTNTLKILEQNHYYPFGLKHENYNSERKIFAKEEAEILQQGQANEEEGLLGIVTSIRGRMKIVPGGGGGGPVVYGERNYKYNGKEFQDELGLNLFDYGARNYDPAIGRWMNIDPLAETSRRFSPYTYCLNNPVFYIDPDGMKADDWIVHTQSDGKQAVTYDAEIKTVEQAKAKCYDNVEAVFETGTGSTKSTGEVFEFNKGGEFSVNGNTMNVADGAYTTQGGSYINENASALSQIAPLLQDGGDALTVAGAGMCLTGVLAPVGAVLMSVGGGMSLVGTGMELADDYNSGNWSTEKAITKLAMEAIPAGGNNVFKSLEPAAGKVIEAATIGADRALDEMRDAKVGPYRP